MQRFRQRNFNIHMIEIADNLNMFQPILFDVTTCIREGVDHVILIAVQRLGANGVPVRAATSSSWRSEALTALRSPSGYAATRHRRQAEGNIPRRQEPRFLYRPPR